MTKARSLVNRDALMGAPKLSVARACVAVFDAIQGLRKENQLMALAASFVLLCEACAIEPYEVYAASKNLMVDPMTRTRRAPEFQAMRFHLDTEVLK